jgi:hypothetical protein
VLNAPLPSLERRPPLRLIPSLTPVIALLFLAAGASAQPAPDGPQRPVKGARASLFISPAGKPFHAAAGEPYPSAQWFAEADLDHDGRLTREEFRADFEAFFRRLDTNHDGTISSAELIAYEEEIAPEILLRITRPVADDTQGSDSGQGGGRRGGGRGHGGGHGGGGAGQGGGPRDGGLDGAPAFSLLNISEPVANADANFDGKITLQEFLAAADRRFDALDPKGVGYLTLATLPRTQEQIMIEGRKAKARAADAAR